jgi:hypothetical protein
VNTRINIHIEESKVTMSLSAICAPDIMVLKLGNINIFMEPKQVTQLRQALTSAQAMTPAETDAFIQRGTETGDHS